MRSLLAVVLSMFASGAFAAEKFCYNGAESFRLTITAEKITIKEPGNYKSFEGEYPATGEKMTGADGKTYIGYADYIEGYYNDFKIDEALLTEGSNGVLKVRDTHEGHLDSTFTCEDIRRETRFSNAKFTEICEASLN